MRLSLNSTEIHEANSNAMSLWANVPPYRPGFAIIPRAPVFSIHCRAVRIKL